MKKSVVIRGSIAHQIKPNNYIKQSVESIRSWFDGEIVVSTWIDQEQALSEIKHLVDKIVLIEDPGPGPIQNIIRQITSFKYGVEACSGEEVLVTRPDITFSNDIFQFLNLYPKYTEQYRFVDNKIIVGNVMTINPDSVEVPNTYRVSDWFHCGKIGDIKKLYSGLDLIKYCDILKLRNSQTCTEKVWLLSVLSSYFKDINIFDSFNIDGFSWEAILNNFVVLNSYSTLGIHNFNYPHQQETMYCYMTQEQYEQRYNVI